MDEQSTTVVGRPKNGATAFVAIDFRIDSTAGCSLLGMTLPGR